jgi:AcrR family transcriptional regulator
MASRPKRARTRAALILATAREMERFGIEKLTVARIADRAGVAHGTFYLYFENRIEAAMAVRRVYDAAMRGLRPRGGRHLPAIEAISRMNRFYVASYRANADLLRALQLLLYTQPAYARWRDRINAAWGATILRDLLRRSAVDAEGVATRMLEIRAAIAMADETLREIYVHRSESLARLLPSEEDVVWFVSTTWHRLLFETGERRDQASDGGGRHLPGRSRHGAA